MPAAVEMVTLTIEEFRIDNPELLRVLQLSVDRHASAFGAIENDVRKRYSRT